MSVQFSDKTAIVTGSGNGIGAAIAHRLAAAGASVMLADNNEESAHAVCAEITAAGGRAAACKVDIRIPEEVQAMIAAGRAVMPALWSVWQAAPRFWSSRASAFPLWWGSASGAAMP